MSKRDPRLNFEGARHAAILLVACLFGFSTLAVADSERPEYFPLEKGTFWIYRGETKFLIPGKDETGEEKAGTNVAKSEVLTWKMEVIDTLERPNVYAALIKGGPWDLAWYKPGKSRGDYVILRVGGFRYYQYSGEVARELWKTLQESDPQLIPSGIVEGEIMLDFPMAAGKAFGGDFSGILRSRYCWVVEGVSPLKKQNFKRNGKLTDSIEYSLSYRTNPDHQMLGFTTGVGIVSYVYNHHGTLSATDLQLIEFGKAEQRDKPEKRTKKR